MKRNIFIIAALLLSAFSLQVSAQQGKWVGTVTYQLTWAGNIPEGAQLPNKWEAKVYENKTKSDSFIWAMSGLPATEFTDATKKTVTFTFDFSMIPMEELNGKWFIREKVKDEDLAEASYRETGKTKEMAGKKVKEFECSYKDEEGKDVTETIWACDEIGPVVDLMHYVGLKAMPFEYTISFGEELSCTFAVSELTPGKVKNTELIMEAGYEELTQDEFMEKLNSAIGEQGGGDDDF